MHDRDRLLQRELDGALGPAEASAVRRLTQDEPALARTAKDLHALDADLQALAAPLRMAGTDALQGRVLAGLPSAPPARQVRVRPADVMFTVIIAVLVVTTYGILGTAVSSLIQEAVVLTWLMGLSLAAGLALLVAPGFLRAMESGLMGRLLGRPVAIGPADALIYRGAGAALVVGALWLGF